MPGTWQVCLRILIAISSAEFLIMLLLSVLAVPLDIYTVAVLDTAMLALISTPLIIFWVIRPFVMARDEALAHINQLASTDPLTRLGNRRELSAHLQRVIAECNRHQTYASLLLVDLDGFKAINDKYGHDNGDKVLTTVAGRLRGVTRAEDMVVRFGGDEFVVLTGRLGHDRYVAREKASRIANKLIESIRKTITVNGLDHNISASIGISIIGEGNQNDETILIQADQAMYNAKHNGKGCSAFYRHRDKHEAPGQEREIV